MFGIRNFLKRHFSVEAMTESLERKISADMARNPKHIRNAFGEALIESLQSTRHRESARRELADLVPIYNRKAFEVKAKMDAFVSQTPEWQVAHADERERIQWEINALNQAAERIKSLAEVAGGDLTAVTIDYGRQ